MHKNRQEEDLILISNIINGDSKSEKILYDKYKKIIYSYINKNYPHVDVEDTVSEILIKVFSKINTYSKEKSKFNSWVLNITKNFIIDISRNTGNWINHFTCNISTTKMPTDYVHDTTLIDIENDSTINHISNTLDGDDYSFLNMHYSQGYSYGEIANIYNTTSNTVSNRVNYIKTKLRKTINYEFN